MASSEERKRVDRTERAVMRLSPPDNVAVALRPLKAGETVMLDGVALTVNRNIPVGQKLAARAIEKGELILKYSCPIGIATVAIKAGEYLHAGNVEARYGSTLDR
jgi:SAF domain-containing protein